jgi:hypothetical protein
VGVKGNAIMRDRHASRAPSKGERREPSRTDHADPKGTPTEDRHTTETAGGQHKHDQPHTIGHPAKGKHDGD